MGSSWFAGLERGRGGGATGGEIGGAGAATEVGGSEGGASEDGATEGGTVSVRGARAPRGRDVRDRVGRDAGSAGSGALA